MFAFQFSYNLFKDKYLWKEEDSHFTLDNMDSNSCDHWHKNLCPVVKAILTYFSIGGRYFKDINLLQSIASDQWEFKNF